MLCWLPNSVNSVICPPIALAGDILNGSHNAFPGALLSSIIQIIPSALGFIPSAARSTYKSPSQ